MWVRFVAGVLAVSILLAACGNDDSGGGSTLIMEGHNFPIPLDAGQEYAVMAIMVTGTAPAAKVMLAMGGLDRSTRETHDSHGLPSTQRQSAQWLPRFDRTANLSSHRRWWVSSGGGTRTHNLRINSLIQPVSRAGRISPTAALTRSFGDQH